jgi:hypothetical protein
MSQNSRILARSLAALLFAGAIAPASANAWPLGKLFHMHPHAAQPEDTRIFFHLTNQDGFVQQVKVDGRVYTIVPHGSLDIKASSGTEVYSVTAGIKHHAGDLLVAVTPKTQDQIISIE